jgi:NAD(P)-dependent dehydrogenase (short-subunit alcohol dehydrogenase family)
MNRYDVAGRVALVTGGASGIGAAAAAALRAGGATVWVLDRDVSAVDRPALAADVTRSAEVDAAVEEVVAATGRLDILVHSAGISGPWRSALELSDAEWGGILEVNATGTFYVCRAAVPSMVERGYGRVVLIASIAGAEGNALLPAYAASKAAVIAFGKSLARDVAQDGVLVNVVAPAVIETPMALEQDAETQERMVAAVPLGRMGRPDEAGALIAWLASEDCSFSTGAVYDLSGGRSAG